MIFEPGWKSDCTGSKSLAVGGGTPVVDVAFINGRRGYSLPEFLDRAGLLGTFYTDTYLGNKPWLRRSLKLVPSRLAPTGLRRLLGRDNPKLSPAKVVSFDAFGCRKVWARLRAGSRCELNWSHAVYNKEFCQRVARCGFDGATAVYGFKGACLEIFQAARSKGLRCIMEQNFTAERIDDQLIREEMQLWPGWARGESLDDLAESTVNPLQEREESEWSLADAIVCPSEFVASGLKSLGVDSGKCRLLPYGIDPSRFHPRTEVGAGKGLNLLFSGALGLRKGAPYLLEALRRLRSRSIDCRIAGLVDIEPHRVKEFDGLAQILGLVPPSEVSRMYQWADALVLPSIAEGSALVTSEALACGIPVVTTPNAGSVVRDGMDGFIVPIRNADALAQRIDQLASDRELLRSLSAGALERRPELGLEIYNSRMIELINSLHGVESLSDRCDH